MKFDLLNINRTRERYLFTLVLYGSLVYWLVSSIIHYNTEANPWLLIADLVAIGLTAIMLVSVYRNHEVGLVKKLYCLLWLPIFVINWKYQGGMVGSASYAYFTILVIYLGLLEKATRMYMVLLFCLINLVLTLDRESEILLAIEPMTSSSQSLAVKYWLHSVIVALVVVLVKVQFDKERADIETENRRLDAVNMQLAVKNEALTNQQQQIRSLQNNLEELVLERTLELENKNKELEAYAYDNAHLVRRPLSNILSLIDLLNEESDRQKSTKNQLRAIRKNAKDLDEVVQKINMILH